MKTAVVIDGIKSYYDLTDVRSLIELEEDEVVIASHPRNDELHMAQVVHKEQHRVLLQVLRHKPVDIFFKISHANMRGRIFKIN